ncbi:MAG: hypothetical protein JSV52_12900 [Candidatus Zixiibacteriota bacterium]|nr:MAG: hypothetical protein JSV52_12900 [candidate division Zixibacteria bacterium]
MSITIFDVLGDSVRTVVNEELQQGCHYLLWDLKDDSGVEKPSGVYSCRLNTAVGSATGKMILIR